MGGGKKRAHRYAQCVAKPMTDYVNTPSLGPMPSLLEPLQPVASLNPHPYHAPQDHPLPVISSQSLHVVACTRAFVGSSDKDKTHDLPRKRKLHLRYPQRLPPGADVPHVLLVPAPSRLTYLLQQHLHSTQHAPCLPALLRCNAGQ